MRAFCNLRKFILVIIFLCPVTSFSQPWIDDSLSVRIYPKEIQGDSILEKIYCTIINNTSATYVTPLDLYIKPIGLNSPPLYAWPLYSPYSSNLLFLFKSDAKYHFGSGSYPVYYCQFPKLLIIPPYSERTFIISLKKFSILNIKNKWNLFGRIAFANKDSLENIINKFYPDRYNEYSSSLIFNDLVSINETDSLKSLSNCHGEIDWDNYEKLPPDNLEKIKDAFEIILWSY